MLISDRIAHCDKCFDIARKAMPTEPNELFQRAWLKVRELEIKDSLPDIRNYVNYFSRVIYTTKMDIYREIKKPDIIIDSIERDYTDLFKDFADMWCRDLSGSEEEKFYKGLIQVLLSVNFNKSEIIKQATMGRPTLYFHLSIAYKMLKDDWTRYYTSNPYNL